MGFETYVEFKPSEIFLEGKFLTLCSSKKLSVVSSGTEGEPKWYLTGIYGYPEVAKRPETCELLKKLKWQIRGSWLVFGDYNEILHLSKKKVGEIGQKGKWKLLGWFW